VTMTYQGAERFKVQAINDFIVFSLQVLVALSSGFILVQFGWEWIIDFSLLWLLILIPVLLLARKSEFDH